MATIKGLTIEIGGGNRMAINQEPLRDVKQVWTGKSADAIARTLQYRRDERDHTALAVGPRDMNDRILALRIPGGIH